MMQAVEPSFNLSLSLTLLQSLFAQNDVTANIVFIRVFTFLFRMRGIQIFSFRETGLRNCCWNSPLLQL